MTVTMGDLTVTMGDLTVTMGDLTVTMGDLTVTMGDLTVTVGDLTQQGQIQASSKLEAASTEDSHGWTECWSDMHESNTALVYGVARCVCAACAAPR